MRQIELTQGKVAWVDNEDFEWLNQLKWYAHKHGNTFYAIRGILINGKYKVQRMHKFIMGDNLGKSDIDHKDGDGLNNQKVNLRICTHQENMMNRRPNKNCSSIYKGVCWHKQTQKWVAKIWIDGKQIHLGYFIIEEDASRAYDKKSTELFGEFARLNFPKHV